MYVIPVFPCRELDVSLAFYRALGFTVTHEQTKPYVYGAVQLEELALNFTQARGAAAKEGGVLCLVMVKDVAAKHQAFADGLRAHYGRVPTAGEPRITRWRAGQTRFHLFDPVGNVLLFIAEDEPEIDYEAYDGTLSALGQAMVSAAFVRDTYTDDVKAGRVLDRALARGEKVQWEGVDVVERARVLAMRAELAVALGDQARATELQEALDALALPEEVWEANRAELEAPQRLARWIETADDRQER